MGLRLVGDTYELDMDSAILDAISRLSKQDKTAVAHFIIDPVVLFILGTTSRRSLTVSEMAPSINLPIATCYKLVYQLEAFGLMSKVGVSRTSGTGQGIDIHVDPEIIEPGAQERFHPHDRHLEEQPA